MMRTNEAINRRDFVKTGILSSIALAAAGTSRNTAAAVIKAAREPFGSLKVGITSYSLRKFSLDEAIAMTRQAGVRYISLKDMHLPLKSTAVERAEARQKVQSAGLVLMGGGVIYLNHNEDEIRRAFEYARDAGMPTIICSPEPAALDSVEKMAKEFDIRIAIHNHGPGDKRYPSPHDVFRMVKDRDPRMGLCMDVGHTVRIGEDPVDAIERCASRLYDFHMKDVSQAAPKGGSVPVGKGVIDIVGVVKTLLQIKYEYHVALEYEGDADRPMPGIMESYAYLRGVVAALS